MSSGFVSVGLDPRIGESGKCSSCSAQRRLAVMKTQSDSGEEVSRRDLLLGLLGLGTAALPMLPASARDVASIPASGLFMKDYLNVIEFEDPKVSGVRLYISDYSRPITEKIQSNFFADPASTSVTCVKTSKLKIAPDVSESREGEEVFSQSRSLLFKNIHVRRILDKEANALVYISYATRLTKGDDDNKSRFKSSMCAVAID
mmetsp:Transcript_4222/g.17868  ORF Transcript_4222/g.17868 Transcript_4222/m.17868 type:complete len:203 (-) Transcript_4222:1564-2172(-)